MVCTVGYRARCSGTRQGTSVDSPRRGSPDIYLEPAYLRLASAPQPLDPQPLDPQPLEGGLGTVEDQSRTSTVR